jgi:signal transduction histidine kinase
MKDDSAHPSMTTLTTPPALHLPARAVRAHALKNCLAVVDAVNNLVASELSEAAQLRLQRSKNAIRRMARLIEEDLRADHNAEQISRWEIVSAAQVLSAVRLHFEDLAAAQRIQLEIWVGAGGVRGDLSSLAEALGNLVKNAIESSTEGSRVILASSRTADGGQLWSVRDTGAGIPRHLIQHLGVPFHSRKPGGSGIGFAVACDIFQLHGGRIYVESAQGLGTLVSVVLPPSAAL